MEWRQRANFRQPLNFRNEFPIRIFLSDLFFFFAFYLESSQREDRRQVFHLLAFPLFSFELNCA